MLGGAAFLLTAIHAPFLRALGEPQPYLSDLVEAIVLAMMLHSGLWFCILKIIRVKLRYLVTPLVFLSGVIFLTMYGTIVEYVSHVVGASFMAMVFIFHLWLVYDLLRGREAL